MALNAAEQENLELLRKWWEDNGMRTVLIAVLLVGGWFSWQFWQNSTASASDAASDIYEEILGLVLTEAEQTISDEDRVRILALSEDLKSAHGDSVYALFGSLFAAQQHVAADDLPAAEQSLQWILDNRREGFFRRTDENLVLVANLRLGRVILAQGDPERALNLVNSLDPGAFEAGFAELRGDIYLQMGRPVDARDAYIAAEEAGATSQQLQMKIQDLPDQS